MSVLDDNCIFCRIARGDLPCFKLVETDNALAFLDINPLADGHVLIIPKQHHETIDAMSAQQAGDVAAMLPALGRAIRQVCGADGFNVLQNNGAAAGQEVAHVHFHLIPRRSADGLGYRWKPKSYEDGRAEQLVESLRAAL